MPFIQDSAKPSLALSCTRLKFSVEVCDAGSGDRLLAETALKVWKLHSWGFAGTVFINSFVLRSTINLCLGISYPLSLCSGAFQALLPSKSQALGHPATLSPPLVGGLPHPYPGADPCKIQFPDSLRSCSISAAIFSKFSHHWLPAYAFPSECQARETGSLPSQSSCQIHGVSDSVSSDNRKLDSVTQEVPSSATFQIKSARKIKKIFFVPDISGIPIIVHLLVLGL